MDTAEHRSMLWDMYVIYSNHGPDSPALSYEDWYNDYYLVDVWVCGSLAADDHDDVADKKPVKMPYDKHDSVLVAKAFQDVMNESAGQWWQDVAIDINMMFELREET